MLVICRRMTLETEVRFPALRPMSRRRAVKLLVKFWRSRRVEVFCPKLWPPRKPPTVWSKQTGRRLFRRTQPLPPETSEVPGALAGAETAPAEAPPPKTDRQSFYDLNFNELDRDLTAEERQEWNSIYASYRGRSALTGTIIGVDPHSITVRNGDSGKMERQTMYCAIVIPYRVRVVIPASEMWKLGHERPDFVLQNMVGASIDFIIIKVDRESGFAIGSRRLAARSQRYFFAHRPALCREGARLKCRLLSVGPGAVWWSATATT